MRSRKTLGVLGRCLLVIFCIVPSFADGKVFSRTVEASVRTPDQRALIHFKDGVQRLVIETAYAGEGTNFAWVVPLPSEPKIEAVSTNFFPDLSRTFQARVIHRPSYVWLVMLWVGALLGCTIWIARNKPSSLPLWILSIVAAVLVVGNLLPAISKGGGSAGAARLPTILQREHVGLYETVVLRGRDGGELLKWLNGNGYYVPQDALPVISSYASNNWVFAAARMNSRGDSATVMRPHPLAFTFEAEEAIYPLRLTGIENGSCEIELFVFGDRRAAARHFKTEFCGEPKTLPKEKFPTDWRAFSLARPGEFRVATEELKKFALPAAVVTKLIGKLSPADMAVDARIKWRNYAPRVPTRYSRDAAITTSLNWGVGIWVSGALLLYWMPSQGWGHFRKSMLALSTVAVVAAVLHFAFAEVVPLRTIKGRAYGYFANLELALRIYDEDYAPREPITFTDLERDFDNWKIENAFTREPIREEASPGNITLHSTSTNTMVRWYDINGVPHEIITFGQQLD